jgi:hypothetical protein
MAQDTRIYTERLGIRSLLHAPGRLGSEIAFLAKPFTPRDLARAVCRLLNNSDPEQY